MSNRRMKRIAAHIENTIKGLEPAKLYADPNTFVNQEPPVFGDKANPENIEDRVVKEQGQAEKKPSGDVVAESPLTAKSVPEEGEPQTAKMVFNNDCKEACDDTYASLLDLSMKVIASDMNDTEKLAFFNSIESAKNLVDKVAADTKKKI